MSTDFEFTAESPRSRHPAAEPIDVKRWFVWFVSHFASTFGAVLLAGVLLLMGLRYYIKASIEGAFPSRSVPAKVDR